MIEFLNIFIYSSEFLHLCLINNFITLKFQQMTRSNIEVSSLNIIAPIYSYMHDNSKLCIPYIHIKCLH